jgi:uncharacterized protein YndB with AHSA1/START domain
VAENKSSTAVFRILIQAPVERVWRELTKTGEGQGAVFNAHLHLKGPPAPGVAMQMRTGSGQHTMVVGEVRIWEPPYRYAHTHRFTQYDDPVCEVHYELKPTPGGVEVTMRIVDLPAGTATAKSMTPGAPQILALLKAIVETGRPPLGTRLMYRMFSVLEFVLPKRTRSEHWPL